MEYPATTLRVTRRDAVVWARIASRNNTIGTRLMVELGDLLATHAAAETARALVLTGDGERFFCPGLDLVEVGALDREAMSLFMERFSRLCLELFSHPKPILAALNGHALAGGFLLAGCCDHRIGREGARMGLTGLNQAVPVPLASLCALESRLGAAGLSASFPDRNFEMSEAGRLGWVERVIPAQLYEAAIEERVHELARQTSAAFWAMKRPLVEPVARRIAAGEAASTQEFLDCWFSEPAQSRLRELRSRLGR